MSPDGETEVVPSKPKRVPRKRVSKSVSAEVDSSAPIKRAPAKRTSRKKAEETLASTEKETKTARKAPTPIAEDNIEKKRSRKQIIIIATMIIIGVGASAAVGMTDKGSIDVDGIIAWRNEEARSTGNEGAIVSEQNTTQLPDGGLIGMGIGGPIDGATSTPSAPATTTASTTASSAAPVGQAPLTNAEAAAAANSETPQEETPVE